MRGSEASQRQPTLIGTLGAALPLGAAIAVFGAIYGAAAGPVLGVAGTLASSAFIFSGALQFAALGLAATGASPVAILLTALALNLRHLVLGALLRPLLHVRTTAAPHWRGSWWTRALGSPTPLARAPRAHCY